MGVVFIFNFILSEFQKENANTKIKVFIEYLYERFGVSDSEEFDNIYFSVFSDDDLIQSLEYYIDKNKVTAQITARNYITYIKDFYDQTLSKYNIKNEIFTNIEHYNQLLVKSQKIISKLKKTKSKDIADDDQYENLISGIEDFLKNFNINDLYDEILKCKNNKIKQDYVRIHHRFVSVIAVKLVMKFALANLRIVSLDYSDLDIENNVLIVDGVQLPLNKECDKELIDLLKTYLRIREYILKLFSRKESKLFIRHDGEPYLKSTSDRGKVASYSIFFKIMKDKIGTEAAELFANRRILEMLDDGVDISTISRISEKSINKCIELQNNNNKEEDSINKLYSFLNESAQIDKKVIIDKKWYTKCPICGEEVKAISDNLILVQYENEDKTLYLACKKCRGQNEKYNS